MIEVVLNDRLGKKVRVKCKCAPAAAAAPLPLRSAALLPCVHYSSRVYGPRGAARTTPSAT